MALPDRAPAFVRAANILTVALARVGFKLVGFGRYPLYLLTARGRNRGQPRAAQL